MSSQAQLQLVRNLGRFPQTRYQGSKQKLLPWIWDHLKELKFSTCLDAFGGTGCVAYMIKTRGKEVAYNDILLSNAISATALIENKSVLLSADEAVDLMRRRDGVEYPNFISQTFKEVYFTPDEDDWIDTVRKNISLLNDKYKQAIAYHALFQSCIVKRPYNLFHRANLYMRTSDVKRNFGNKTTWDKQFSEHFVSFVAEANDAVLDNDVATQVLNKDVFDLETDFDLVYIDPPYMNKNGLGPDYFDFYHFLEGLADYDNWPTRLDRRKKHLPLLAREKCVWLDTKRVLNAFETLFEKFRRSILVVSYRSDGIPSPEQLVDLLRKQGRSVENYSNRDYKYVLSSNGASKEALIVAT
jgi:adenine-specific DNA-methyltransferase